MRIEDKLLHKQGIGAEIAADGHEVGQPKDEVNEKKILTPQDRDLVSVDKRVENAIIELSGLILEASDKYKDNDDARSFLYGYVKREYGRKRILVIRDIISELARARIAIEAFRKETETGEK